MRRIRDTYRLQLNEDFDLQATRAIVPYLAKLGVSHIYCSPMLKARSGSRHGYDVVDPTLLNPSLGTERDFEKLVDTLHEAGMGIVLDIVPNHMAAHPENAYWDDVLANGRSSPYADWFDVDWQPADTLLKHRFLLPVLGDRLSRVIARDELAIRLTDGGLRVAYFEQSFPLDPATIAVILEHRRDEFAERASDPETSATYDDLIDSFKSLPRRLVQNPRNIAARIEGVHEATRKLAALCRSADIRAHLQRVCADFTEGVEGRMRLEVLLRKQVYQLAHWRRAAGEITYRRFFNINELVALRVEDQAVFGAIHGEVFRWVEGDRIDALRIDHIDGLLDPLAYLKRLNRQLSVHCAGLKPASIYVEKILSEGEKLSGSWPVCGTTGYEFGVALDTLFIESQGTKYIVDYYRARILHRDVTWAQIGLDAKRYVLKTGLLSDLRQLARLMQECLDDAGSVRFPLRMIMDAICELIACLPVYRTYVDESGTLSEADRRVLDEAISRALLNAPKHRSAIAHLADILRLEGFKSFSPERQRKHLRFLQRYQQLSGPATAKGIEDTASYIYVPLVMRNEVGGEPQQPLEDAVEHFHEANEERARRWPQSMLCTTTHDTKRSADVRARLAVLSEIPQLWTQTVNRWCERHHTYRTQVRGQPAPDLNTEYLFYQTVLGVWPMPTPKQTELISENALEMLRQRIQEYMLKAVREAKVHTRWLNPDARFENAVRGFIHQLLTNANDNPFLADVNTIVGQVARLGIWNALGRTLVHLAAPGVPDLYQGDELWNFTLVDPDNRRPVDFEYRKQLLDQIDSQWHGSSQERHTLLREMICSPEDGRLKLHIIQRSLEARRNHPDLFLNGGYHRLQCSGDKADHIFAFARISGGAAGIVLIPRVVTRLLEKPEQPPIAGVWSQTMLHVPAAVRRKPLCCALTGRVLKDPPEQLAVQELLHDLPVALLLSSS